MRLLDNLLDLKAGAEASIHLALEPSSRNRAADEGVRLKMVFGRVREERQEQHAAYAFGGGLHELCRVFEGHQAR